MLQRRSGGGRHEPVDANMRQAATAEPFDLVGKLSDLGITGSGVLE